MPNPLLSSVLPVLRNLPENFPREPLLPGLKRRPFSVFPLLMFALFAGAVIFAAVQIASLPDEKPASSNATGRVTQVERTGGNGPSSASMTFVKYRFMVGERLIYGNTLLSPQEVAPNIGDEIEISYSPAQVSDNAPVTLPTNLANERVFKRIAVVVVPVFVFIWALFMFSLLSPVTPRDWLIWRRARGLYRKGELATGRVQFVRNSSGVRSPNRNADYEIVATYKVEGVRFSVATRCDNQWLINQLAPETQVVVAHDPLKPERAVILEPFAF